MRSVRVISTTKVDSLIRVVKEIEDDDGNLSLNLHVMDEETLEWRAAELGYDPDTEIDKVIDYIMYEPYFPNGQPTLYDFDDDEAIKTEFESRVQQAKARLIPTNRPDRATIANLRGRIDDEYLSEDNPVQAIKDLSIIGREEYEIKREHINNLKEQVREARRKIASMEIPAAQESRADRLRLQLGGNRGINNGPEG